MEGRLTNHPDLKGKRVIALIDLDAFYSQVEMIRLNSPRDVPLAVQQWQGLIAVNYAARAKGIKRHMTIEEAKKAAPDIVFAHVPTIGPGDVAPKYHPNPSYATHKVSLDPYRKASTQIFRIFMRFCEKVQRASVDEAYLDLTDMCIDRIIQQFSTEEIEKDWEHGPLVEWNDETVIVGGATSSKGWANLQLKMGAQIVSEIRKAVWDELHFTCSAGIAGSKTVAKLIAGLNKPNKQTLIAPEAVLSYFDDLPFQNIRMLGGKLGKEIQEGTDAEKCSDLWKYSVDDLERTFGEGTGKWIHDIVRGVCNEPVAPQKMVKSMMAAKSFRPGLKTNDQVNEWIHTLSSEIFYRLSEDWELNARWPKTLSIAFKNPTLDKGRSCPFPPRTATTNATVIAAKAQALFWTEEVKNATFPIFRMSIQANGLETVEKGLSSLEKFLDEAPTGETEPCPRCQKQIPIEKKEEHADWHVALDVSKEWASSENTIPVKRKAHSQPSIAKFFKKAQ